MGETKTKGKDNSGALFRNDPAWIEAGGEKSRPAYSGVVRIGGVSYRLSGWVKAHDDVVGGTYISIVVKPAEGNDDGKEPF